MPPQFMLARATTQNLRSIFLPLISQPSLRRLFTIQQCQHQHTNEGSGVLPHECSGVLPHECSGVLHQEGSGVLHQEGSGVLHQEGSGVLHHEVPVSRHHGFSLLHYNLRCSRVLRHVSFGVGFLQGQYAEL
jgi:hypothetical protein